MREGMLCGMWEGPLGHLSGTWSSTSLLSSGPVQFCMLVVGVRGSRLRGWVGGGNRAESSRSIATQRTREGRSHRTKKPAKSDAHPCYFGNVSKTRPQTHRPVAQ